MAKRSSRNRRRQPKTKVVDRISSLPDELICYILSFLQTNEAATTSVLSTRWKSLWTLVPSLEIKDGWPCFSQQSFATVVNQIFAQRQSESILSLSLESYKKHSNPRLVPLLLTTSLSQNLKELDLIFYFPTHVVLPSELFTSQIFYSLKLEGTINLNVPQSVHLPSLKVLHILAGHIEDHEPISRLLAGCPVLEELCCMDVEIDNICMPLLKILIVKSRHRRLEIDTPSLEIIRISETKVVDYEVKSMEKLEQADIDIFFDYEDEKDNIHKLFNGLHRTKYLSLTTGSTEVLTYACVNFPEFHNLARLQLHLLSLDSNFIVELLLDKCPKLQVLQLERIDECRDSEIQWVDPTIRVPNCLSSHLTKFIFRGYGFSKEEMKLVGYFLENAEVLKTATIEVSTSVKPKEARHGVKNLYMMPKGSRDCRLNFNFVA